MHHINKEERCPLHGWGVEVCDANSMMSPKFLHFLREYHIESLPKDGLKPVDDNHIILNIHVNECTYL